MSDREKFEYEMMSTPELALELQNLKAEIRHYQSQKNYYRDIDNIEYERFTRLYRKTKVTAYEVEKVLKARQMTLF